MGLILTGLPWAKGWGTYLIEIRELTGTSNGPVDWTIGGKPPVAAAIAAHHADHLMGSDFSPGAKPEELERVIATVRQQHLAPPISIRPPETPGAPWLVASESANRPLRSDLIVNGATGQLIERTDFSERHWIDKTIGYGIALHEGQLFGLANQIAGTLTALFLVILSVSGAAMWWKRRPSGVLGAPAALARPDIGAALIASICLLAIYMPMFGLTLVLVLVAEALVLRRMDRLGKWLGLRSSHKTDPGVPT
jgi:uncharacterized iron-regulated membrane protein